MARRDPAYFLPTFTHLYDATSASWLPFAIWDAQRWVLGVLKEERLSVALKARQLGMSWLVLGYSLWLVLFRPGSTVLLFSRRDDEAVELMNRIKGMNARLPEWLRGRSVQGGDNDHEWELRTGSRVLAFPTTGGRSYTATLAIVDEADYIPDLNRMLDAVKPTTDAGGQLVLLSSPDKSNPESLFKKIYRAARGGENSYRPVFLPWYARPDRTAAWYEEQKRDCLANTGSLDSLHEQYPATDTEALAPRSLDKRIPAEWINDCYREIGPVKIPYDFWPRPPSLPGLTLYALPVKGRKYVCGADPAEGNPTSDESAATWLDAESGEEVASIAGRFQPTVFAHYLDAVGRWFHGASIMVERNNHGHAVLGALGEIPSKCGRFCGLDGKPGWLSNIKGKAEMYNQCADAFRDRDTLIHSFGTLHQLASIEGGTLRAPEGLPDDRADAYALAVVGMYRTASKHQRQRGFAPYVR